MYEGSNRLVGEVCGWVEEGGTVVEWKKESSQDGEWNSCGLEGGTMVGDGVGIGGRSKDGWRGEP